MDPALGRFRSFLLASLKHFLGPQRERAHALKRGRGIPLLALDAMPPSRGPEGTAPKSGGLRCLGWRE